MDIICSFHFGNALVVVFHSSSAACLLCSDNSITFEDCSRSVKELLCGVFAG